VITASLLILAVLSYLGPSLVQLASVFGMALALWLSRDRSLPVQLVFLVIGSLMATIAAEIVHVSHHAYAAAMGREDPLHGGLFMSAVLVGLINCLAMVPAVWFTELRKRRGRTDSRCPVPFSKRTGTAGRRVAGPGKLVIEARARFNARASGLNSMVASKTGSGVGG
jgi:hypothetical protein